MEWTYGMDLRPWDIYTYGQPHSAKIVSGENRSMRIQTPVQPQEAVTEISRVYNNPKAILYGLSPTFRTGSRDDYASMFKMIKEQSHIKEEPSMETNAVDYIFALSYSCRQDTNGSYTLTKDIWDEACEIAERLVGSGKTVRFWVDGIDRKTRQEKWSLGQVYPYLAWPVIFVVRTFPSTSHSRAVYPKGYKTLRMWPSVECTAGFVGKGIVGKTAPSSAGQIFQHLVKGNGLLWNQTYSSRSIEDQVDSFALHIGGADRFWSHPTFHSEAYSEVRTHFTLYYMTRFIHGQGAYGPLKLEEPQMASGFRYELLSNRWQPVGQRTFTNDQEWVPMEGGLSMVAGNETVDPDFKVRIYEAEMRIAKVTKRGCDLTKIVGHDGTDEIQPLNTYKHVYAVHPCGVCLKYESSNIEIGISSKDSTEVSVQVKTAGQRLAVLSDCNGRQTMLLLERHYPETSSDGKLIAYYRIPGHFSDADAIATTPCQSYRKISEKSRESFLKNAP